jgi:hypothetical protein
MLGCCHDANIHAGRNVMRILTLLLVLVGLMASGPAYAAELYSASLYATGTATHWCYAANKGTSNVTMTVTIYNAVSGAEVATCGPIIVVPTALHACAYENTNVLTFCKVKTSSGANTRGTHSIRVTENFETSTVASTPVR